jgi:hypothetical protein
MIKTNNRPRRLFYACEVEYSQRAAFRRQFDWMDQAELDCAMFFKYGGNFYTMSQFLRTGGDLLAKGWQGIMGETNHSSLLLKIRESHTSVVIGRLISD